MNREFEIIIGLEVHVQSKTKSKMFCSCDANYFNSAPNSHTCPVCFGLPGALPVPNKFAFDLCIKTALALNCEINKETKFDRKNYFYPDLPKGFQISQYDLPVGKNGHITISTSNGEKNIGITRVHQEEDTGKSLHQNGETLLDFNKSGVPLIEIVSEPDMRSTEEVTAYCKQLRQIIRYLDVSNADMEKGEMRFELNMSLRKTGVEELPKYKVEVKNIASISVLEKVIEKEYIRQSELLQSGQTPRQETRGLVDMSGETRSQRSKETEADYRYFPEPDIPLIVISQNEIDIISKSIPELPFEKLSRYINEYSIDSKLAEVIISDFEQASLFEKLIADLSKEEVSEISKWFAVEYLSLLNSEERNDNFDPSWIAYVAIQVLNGKITRLNGKEVLKESFIKGTNPKEIISSNNLNVITNTSDIEKIIDKIMKENPKAVSDAKAKPNAIMFLVGLAMRELKNKADVKVLREIIDNKLKE